MIVVAGLVALFAPGLFEVWPSSVRDGRQGLVVLVGVQILALRALAKWSRALGKSVVTDEEIPAMPVKIKLGLSLLVVLVTAIAALFQHTLGHARIQYVVAFLGLFMIFAMWLFPEVKRDDVGPGTALAATTPGNS